MRKNSSKRKEIINKIYKCPPLEIICPSRIFHKPKQTAFLIPNQFTDSNEKFP